MNKVGMFIIGVSFTAIMLVASTFIVKKPVNKPVSDNKGFAVVELFTSEGCSSCPPADAVIAKIEKESADKPIYILAFHVDYWNRLGWKDVFSSAAYSQRQQQYAKWLRSGSVYTPQVIINGRTEFIGSEEGKLRSVIKSGLESQSAAQVSLSNIKIDAGKANLDYHTQGKTGNAVLLLAVVQRSAQSKVEKGENAGRTLSHVQIVRSIQSLPLKTANGTTVITLPNGFDKQGTELIAFFQDPASGTIIGAIKSAF